jgi:WD40 repeat protein
LTTAEGVLAAAIITSLFVVWLAIETQPHSAQGQASPSNTHTTTLTTYRQHDSEVQKVAWSPDGQNIASSDIGGNVLIWQASTGKTLMPYNYQPHGSTVLALTWFNADEVLVAYGEPNKSLQVVELIPDIGLPPQIIFHQDNLAAKPQTATWASDHQTLAFDEGDGSVQITNVITDQPIVTIPEKHTHYTQLSWSPDNNQLATLSTDGLLEVWDAYTGVKIISLTANHLASMAIWISCIGYQSGMLLVDSNSTLLKWSYGHRNREEVLPFLTEQAYNMDTTDNVTISALGISPDNSQILLATSDGLVQVRDLLKGNLISVYAEHSAPVDYIEWSPRGRYIATASYDTTVQVWEP